MTYHAASQPRQPAPHLLLLECGAGAQHLGVQVVHRGLHAGTCSLGHALQVLVSHAASAEDAAVRKVLRAQVTCRRSGGGGCISCCQLHQLRTVLQTQVACRRSPDSMSAAANWCHMMSGKEGAGQCGTQLSNRLRLTDGQA